MKLRRMEFGGFRTFAAPTKFDFGSEAGLYFLEGGDNEVDPSLGSNGVGKSTVWSALCWILFGKTADGLKAGDLKSWQSEAKGYYGKLWIGRKLVHRQWRPNKLTLDGEVIEQKKLEEELGLSFDTFISAVVLAQGGDMFLDLTAPRKLSLFTSMLQLDNWINYSSMAKAQAEELRDDLHTVERNVSKLEGKLDGLDIKGIQSKRKKWRAVKTAETQTLSIEVNTAKKDSTKLDRTLRRTKKHRKKLADQLEREKLVEEQALEAWTEAKTAETKIVWDASRLQKEYADAVEAQATVKKQKAGTCDVCGQTINRAKLKKHLKSMEENSLAINAQMTALAIDNDRAEKKVKETKAVVDAAKKQVRDIEQWLNKDKSTFDKIRTAAAMASATLQSKEDRLAEKRKEKNPFIPLVKEAEEEEERLTDKLASRERQHGRMQKKRDDILYWVQGFKDVRLYLIEEALDQLEIETNKALADLGFTSEWRIEYNIDKRSKAGSTISGFTVAVQSPNAKQAVPFAAWSGGEKQRLKIAGSIGFIALVSARTGLDLGIEVYDEPTQHLSPQGIDSLLETLRGRALETGKRIWLVDHHTLDYGDFAGRAVVSKKEDGSKLWQQ